MKIAFFTLGCKVNQYETQSMREAFELSGHTAVAENDDFDAAVVNSCTVTSESDRKTRQLLHKIRRNHPASVIILTGCMAEVLTDSDYGIPEADITVGNTDILKVVYLFERYLKDKSRIFEIEKHKQNCPYNTPPVTDFAERTRAYMKIEDGCERYCSYCIIPFARGFVRSRPIEDIKAEAESLSNNGFSEIVLVGINLSAYGKDNGLNLCDAVEAVCSVTKIKRVRLGSLEPDHISDSMLERLKNQEKFCPQFHLSLQSGCDRTLKRMNRRYDSAFYLDLITRIRKMFPDAAITTDIMVGFPDETEEDFLQSVEFAKKVRFAKSHVFAYSKRPNTVAYSLPGQITNAEKERRSRIMLTVAAESESAFLKNQIGKTLSVLFETFDGKNAEGYSQNYLRVSVETNEDLRGKTEKIKITKADNTTCFGEKI